MLGVTFEIDNLRYLCNSGVAGKILILKLNVEV